MNEAVNIISTLGFPIFCVLALGFFIYKFFMKITEENAKREQTLYDMVAKMQEQLNNAIEINGSFVDLLNDIKNNVASIQDDMIEVKSKIKKGA